MFASQTLHREKGGRVRGKEDLKLKAGGELPEAERVRWWLGLPTLALSESDGPAGVAVDIVTIRWGWMDLGMRGLLGFPFQECMGAGWLWGPGL